MLAVALACGCAAAPGAALAARPSAKSASASPRKASRYAAGAMPAGARQYYATTWGVDRTYAKLAESGQLVRFSYRVIDAVKAKPLQDRASSPSLVDAAAHVALTIPTLEKVGPLRQSMPAQDGQTYWMMFSNKGNRVRRGDRVSVAVGAVRIDGLIVQ